MPEVFGAFKHDYRPRNCEQKNTSAFVTRCDPSITDQGHANIIEVAHKMPPLIILYVTKNQLGDPESAPAPFLQKHKMFFPSCHNTHLCVYNSTVLSQCRGKQL